MAAIEMFGTFVHSHVAMTRKMWASIDQISEQDCLAEDKYSRGPSAISWCTRPAGRTTLPDVR